jgi:hypothetical protein
MNRTHKALTVGGTIGLILGLIAISINIANSQPLPLCDMTGEWNRITSVTTTTWTIDGTTCRR